MDQLVLEVSYLIFPEGLNPTGDVEYTRMLNINDALVGLASHPGGSRNTPSRFMLQKPELSAGS